VARDQPLAAQNGPGGLRRIRNHPAPAPAQAVNGSADTSLDMQLLSRNRPATAVNMRRLAFETDQPIQFLDITDQIAEIVRQTGVVNGIVSIVSRHTTVAVRIQEDEPLLLQDLLTFLRRLAPSNVHYQHNDFRTRTHHMHEDESPNGHSHCLQFVLGTSETVPVMDGELMLGEWQRIFAVELDGPRARREVLIQTVGVADEDDLDAQLAA
jgi:secondary thiamine-phosphate synthase enzyme